MIPAYRNVARAHSPLETKSRQETWHTNLFKYIATAWKREKSHESGNPEVTKQSQLELGLACLFLGLCTNYGKHSSLSFWITGTEVRCFTTQLWSAKVNQVLYKETSHIFAVSKTEWTGLQKLPWREEVIKANYFCCKIVGKMWCVCSWILARRLVPNAAPGLVLSPAPGAFLPPAPVGTEETPTKRSDLLLFLIKTEPLWEAGIKKACIPTAAGLYGDVEA